ncbi:MAG: glycoside hydrolase family 2 TIM barrel-domain containing protein [Planctomycetota bacterium]
MNASRLLSSAVCIALSVFAAAQGQAQVDNAGADNMVPLAPTSPDTPDAENLSAEYLPEVRLTPPVVAVEGLDAFKLDLSGTWQFAPEVPVPFTGRAEQVETWHDVQMPGHFALQGHDPLGREPGDAVAFFKSFDVPANWDGRSVALRFGSLDGYARLWINGQPVGANDSAFLPVEFDATPFLKPGETNDLALTIEVSPLTGWYRRQMGGMARKAELIALPSAHLSRMHADAAFDEGQPRLTVDVTVRNDADDVLADAAVTAELLDADGNAIKLDEPWVVSLDPVNPRGQRKAQLQRAFPGLEPWTPETPNLYTLRVTLDSPGASVVTERPVGFRTIQVDAHRVLVNGQNLKVFGINYHVTHPGYGHFPPPGLIAKDLNIFRDHNVNALRTWPTPYRDLIDAANTLGLWATIEVPVNLQLYAPGPLKDHGNNPALHEPYLHLAARVVETYRSDPSVLFWGLANESIYYPYFQRAGEAIQRTDPTRPVFFGGDGRMGVDIPGTDLHDEHYPRDGRATVDNPGDIRPAPHPLNHPDKPANFGWTFPKNKPAISSEWLHTHVNNTAQINVDPGVDDFWGYHAAAHADWTRNTPNFVGGFQFLSAPYWAIGGRNHWRGLIDDDRRPTTNLWHLKKAYSPIAIGNTDDDPDIVDAVFDVELRRAKIKLVNRHQFLDLDALEVRIGQDPEQLPLVPVQAAPGQPVTVEVDWEPDDRPMHVVVDSPRGFEIDRFVLEAPPWKAEPSPNTAADPKLKLEERDGQLHVKAGDTVWTLDAETGELLGGSLHGQPILTAGPDFVLRANGVPGEGNTIAPMSDLLHNWETTSVDGDRDDDQATVTVTGKFPHAEGSYTYTFRADGSLTLDYALTWTWEFNRKLDVFEYGVAFHVADDFDTLHWQRDAQWTAYPKHHIGRAEGNAPAAGDPKYASADPKPWSQDLHADGTSRDFRSSKFFFRESSLTDSEGVGLQAIGDGSQHVRANKTRDGGFRLLIGDFHHGGSEFHMIKSLRFQTLFLGAGDTFEGSATIRLVNAD